MYVNCMRKSLDCLPLLHNVLTLCQTTPDNSNLWTKSVIKRSEIFAVAYIPNNNPETGFHFLYECKLP
jgi:hypothetical protein